MYNDLLTIGSFSIHTYGLMTAIGILSAYFTAEYRARKMKLDSGKIFGFVIYCLIFGYLCSKILYFITVLPSIIEDPSLIMRSLTDGWVVYGGILGGLLGAFIYCKSRKLPVWSYFDIGLASVALAQGFGRIGCFFAGCCYGAVTDSRFAVVFTHADFAPNGVPLIPTQLLSSAFDFVLFAILLVFEKRKNHKSGQGAGLYLIMYGVGRFIIEFFRGDLARGSVGVLSTSQFISVFIIIAGVIVMMLRTKNGKGWETVDYKAAIFDLDGTILHTFDSIAAPVNKALVNNGFEEIPVENFRYFIGDGFKNTVIRSLKHSGDENLEKFDAVFTEAKKLFEADPLYKVAPYEGIKEAVETLKADGCKLAVLTNKAHDSAVEVVEYFFGKGTFDVISGDGNNRALKPDLKATNEVLKKLKVSAPECAYFGDSSTDMITGKNAKLFTVGVSWGSRPRKELEDNKADLIIDSAKEIPAVIKKKY